MVSLTPEVEEQSAGAPVTDHRTPDTQTLEGWNETTPDGRGAQGSSPDEAGSDQPGGGSPAANGGGPGGGGRFLRRGRVQRPGGDSDKLDLRNTWQVVAGSILVPLGVVFILIAWYGAAHTPYVQQQIPYLVSGSFEGVACMVLGGLLYWAHWLYRIYDQADHHHEEQLQVMQQTLRAIADRLGASSSEGRAEFQSRGDLRAGLEASSLIGASTSTSSPRPASEIPAGASSEPTYVVTPAGSVFHDPSCPIVGHHSNGLRVVREAEVSGMEPCGICLG